ncbi:MrcB family domain-containing protein [Streptomyces sp. HMX112]|uniref:MrcB family domain-containing protein n=1 Tax=Streptomyces sp. HMX112 TaxID=3390850 RepID=UPI003A80FFA2
MGYGGQGTATLTPWIGVFDRTINENPHDGLYLAYIFDSSRTAVTLTLQQGITSLSDTYGKGARLHRYLTAQSQTLRGALRPKLAKRWQDALTLHVGPKHWRPRSYEKANVAARRYEIDRLPSDEGLTADLDEAVQLLRDAAAVDRFWLKTPKDDEPVIEYLPVEAHHGDGPFDPLSGFRAKGSDSYYVDIQGDRQERAKEHEALLLRFAHHAVACGYTPLTQGMHPRDVVLRHPDVPGQDWLVEGKTVKAKKEYLAVREAVGQLYEYRHFYYEKRKKHAPHLIALFTADIGDYADYLETLAITSVWERSGGWGGSRLAVEWGLAK